MLTGANIICFAKDWSEDPTSNNHVMKLLARDTRLTPASLEIIMRRHRLEPILQGAAILRKSA